MRCVRVDVCVCVVSCTPCACVPCACKCLPCASVCVHAYERVGGREAQVARRPAGVRVWCMCLTECECVCVCVCVSISEYKWRYPKGSGVRVGGCVV